MTNKLNIYERLKDVICITGRKRSAAAGFNATEATIWKIELYKGSVFQTGSHSFVFPWVALRLPAVMQILSFGQFCTDAARQSLRLNYLNLLNSEALNFLNPKQ